MTVPWPNHLEGCECRLQSPGQGNYYSGSHQPQKTRLSSLLSKRFELTSNLDQNISDRSDVVCLDMRSEFFQTEDFGC